MIFDVDIFIPRGHCGEWAPFFKELYMYSSLAIWAAYMAIPAVLLFTLTTFTHPELLSESDRKKARVVYAAFIGMCGFGHLEGVLAFQWPAYHAFAVWHALTAAVSWTAVLLTWKLRFKLVTI